MRRLWIGIAVIALVATAAVAADYIGAAKCKICHKLQHQSWQEMKHAKAFDALKPEEQGKEECLKCHATGGKAELLRVESHVSKPFNPSIAPLPNGRFLVAFGSKNGIVAAVFDRNGKPSGKEPGAVRSK